MVSRLRPFLPVLFLFVALTLAQAPSAPMVPVSALSQPALSPDGAQIAFVAGGDIWTVPAAGGAAHLLISDPATESRPLYSPDGKWLAFDSTRTGNGDIYLFELSTGHLHRLTYDDGNEALDAWSPDSQWVYYSSTAHNIGGMNDIYRVRITGGTPMTVASERYVNLFYAAPAPDGTVAFSARGLGSSQWWRKGGAHIDETEIWKVQPITSAYDKIVPDGAKQLWPMWSPDGRVLYYMSNRGGNENIWEMTPPGAARSLTTFRDGRVLWPNIAANGKAIVFERDFAVWKLDPRDGKAAQVPIQLLGSPAAPNILQHLSVTAPEAIAVSPDGRKVAFVAHGEVFAAGTADGGAGIRVTHAGALQFDLTWSPDNHHLLYASDRGGHNHLYLYDFATSTEQPLTSGATEECHPVFSPDGKQLLFQRGATDLVLMDMTTHKEMNLAKGYFERPPLGQGGLFAWSPDGKWVAYLSRVDGAFSNALVVPTAGGESRAVSFLPNSNGGSLQWSPDAKFLLLQTGQRTEPTRIARVDLVLKTPVFHEDQFHDLFENGPGRGGPRQNGPVAPTAPGDDAEAAPAAGGRRGAAAPAPPPTTTIAFDGIAQRVSLLPMTDAREPKISPDGKWLAYVGGEGGRGGNIYLYSLDENAPAEAGGGGGGRGGGGAPGGPRQLTTTGGGKRDIQFTSDSREIYYLEGGRINHIAVTGGQPRAVNVTAELDVNFDQEKEEVFQEAWRYLRDNYMNPAMNGANWDDVQARFAPVVAGAATPDDLRLVLSEMIGELNSSHSGIMGGGMRRTSTGRLGVQFDRAQFEDHGRLCISEVIPLGPAALDGVKAGECIAKLNGVAVDAHTNFAEAMDDTVGKKVTVDLVGADGANAHSIALKPIAGAADKNLIYLAWVEHNREYVDKLSNGALGYVHMNDMSQAALDKLYLDLDSVNFARKGVVVDIRNNNGGFVNAYALDVLSRRPYLTMTPRDFPQSAARTALGQRALEKPTVLLTNQNTLSDSEDFTEGYRAMNLGKVVGTPTAGWIIFTSNVGLIDGSTVRLPTDRILDHNGKDMELHPRPVDVDIQNPIGSWAQGKDPQLEQAVKTLLAQVSTPSAIKAATGNGPIR